VEKAQTARKKKGGKSKKKGDLGGKGPKTLRAPQDRITSERRTPHRRRKRARPLRGPLATQKKGEGERGSILNGVGKQKQMCRVFGQSDLVP